MMYDLLVDSLFDFRIWLIIAVIFFVIEVFTGTTQIFFLPIAIGAVVISIIMAGSHWGLYSLNFLGGWAWWLVLWGVISLVVSVFFAKRQKAKRENEGDINQY